MPRLRQSTFLFLSLIVSILVHAAAFPTTTSRVAHMARKVHRANSSSSSNEYPNKAMRFLMDMGRIGGAANQDFTHVIGVDEGPAGKKLGVNQLRQQRSNIPTVVRESLCAGDTPGIMRDHVSSPPTTDVTWSAVTDQVMGGCSVASLTNDDDFYGRTAHVLRAHVSTANKGGFAQLATNLCAFNNNGSPMDASSFDGVEMDVLCEAQDGVKESFNVHLKTSSCAMPFSAYRASFEVSHGKWKTIRIPFRNFCGHGPGAADKAFDARTLVRTGIVAIGRDMTVTLGVSDFRFYRRE